MKFYDCQTAPSPRRARIFIAEKGIDIETIEIDLGKRGDGPGYGDHEWSFMNPKFWPRWREILST